MDSPPHRHGRDLLLLNGANVILSASILFSRWIHLPAEIIILGRSGVAALVLALFLALTGGIRLPPKGVSRFVLFFSGVILAFHWVSYFHAAKKSTIAVAVITLYTYPVGTILLESLLLKHPVGRRELLFALSILGGVYLMGKEPGRDDFQWTGILWGLAASFSFSLRNILTGKYLIGTGGALIMLAQTGVATLVLLPFAFVSEYAVDPPSLSRLLLLGALFTALGHTLFVRSLLRMPVKTASIIAGVQPAYAVLLAYLFFGEIPEQEVLLGGGVIFITSFGETLLRATGQKSGAKAGKGPDPSRNPPLPRRTRS